MERIGAKEVKGIGIEICGEFRMVVAPPANNERISVDSEANCGRFLPKQHRSSSQVGLDVNSMRRKNVDDVLIAATFSARIPHGPSIVTFGDAVKRQSQFK